MRTTLTLDPDVDRLLRENALRTHRPIKRVLNEALRAALTANLPHPQPTPFVVVPRPLGLRPGHDPIGFTKLADDLEAAAFVDLTAKLRQSAP